MNNQPNNQKAIGKVITVDEGKCIGCGLCVSACPDVFELDENGKSFVKNPSGCAKCDCQEELDNCPSKAISWQE